MPAVVLKSDDIVRRFTEPPLPLQRAMALASLFQPGSLIRTTTLDTLTSAYGADIVETAVAELGANCGPWPLSASEIAVARTRSALVRRNRNERAARRNRWGGE
jgi:hypothetical protein